MSDSCPLHGPQVCTCRFTRDAQETARVIRLAKVTMDLKSLVIALDDERASRRISWRALAGEVGISPSTFSRMRAGKRPDVDSFMSILQWLGIPSSQFAIKKGGGNG